MANREHVMANAESSSSSPNCFFCATPLPISWQRRTLERTAGELNRKVHDFLEVFVTEGCLAADGDCRYVCKPCFTRVDRARRQVEASEKSINELRPMSRTDLPLVKLIAVDCDSQQPSDTDTDSSDERGFRTGSKRRTPHVPPVDLSTSPKRRRQNCSPGSHEARRALFPTSITPVNERSHGLFLLPRRAAVAQSLERARYSHVNFFQ